MFFQPSRMYSGVYSCTFQWHNGSCSTYSYIYTLVYCLYSPSLVEMCGLYWWRKQNMCHRSRKNCRLRLGWHSHPATLKLAVFNKKTLGRRHLFFLRTSSFVFLKAHVDVFVCLLMHSYWGSKLPGRGWVPQTRAWTPGTFLHMKGKNWYRS